MRKQRIEVTIEHGNYRGLGYYVITNGKPEHGPTTPQACASWCEEQGWNVRKVVLGGGRGIKHLVDTGVGS